MHVYNMYQDTWFIQETSAFIQTINLYKSVCYIASDLDLLIIQVKTRNRYLYQVVPRTSYLFPIFLSYIQLIKESSQHITSHSVNMCSFCERMSIEDINVQVLGLCVAISWCLLLVRFQFFSQFTFHRENKYCTIQTPITILLCTFLHLPHNYM